LRSFGAFRTKRARVIADSQPLPSQSPRRVSSRQASNAEAIKRLAAHRRVTSESDDASGSDDDEGLPLAKRSRRDSTNSSRRKQHVQPHKNNDDGDEHHDNLEDDDGSDDDEELDYEQIRQRNIQQQKDLLKQLGLAVGGVRSVNMS
jgi:hypothetical protein